MGYPQYGPAVQHPEYLNLQREIEEGRFSVRGEIKDDDWRQVIADRNGDWAVWFEVSDNNDLIARVGLISHSNNEASLRAKGLCTIRPFVTPRSQVPVASVLGSLMIPDRSRAVWAQADNKRLDWVASALKNSSDWIIVPEPETARPMCCFDPMRWRASVNKRDANSQSGG